MTGRRDILILAFRLLAVSAFAIQIPVSIGSYAGPVLEFDQPDSAVWTLQEYLGVTPQQVLFYLLLHFFTTPVSNLRKVLSESTF